MFYFLSTVSFSQPSGEFTIDGSPPGYSADRCAETLSARTVGNCLIMNDAVLCYIIHSPHAWRREHSLISGTRRRSHRL